MILNHGANCHARRDCREPGPLCCARTGLPQGGGRRLPPSEVVDHGRHAGDLLRHPLDPLGPRCASAGPGGAGRPGQPAVLLLLDRDLAAGVPLRRRAPDHGRAGPVPVHLDPGPGVVRLCLPADRVGRSLPACGALDRRRPQRPVPAAQAALEPGEDRPAVLAMDHLADHRGGHRRGLDLLFRRRAGPVPGAGVRNSALRRLRHRRRADRNDLRARRFHARAGLHLHVPLAAHPGGDAGRELADRHLQGVARRAARQAPQEGGRGAFGRLHRLRRLCRGLPDRGRYPPGPADRLHHLRAVHRRLRCWRRPGPSPGWW